MCKKPRAAVGAHLVYLSTDYVLLTARLIVLCRAWDMANPQSVYGLFRSSGGEQANSIPEPRPSRGHRGFGWSKRNEHGEDGVAPCSRV